MPQAASTSYPFAFAAVDAAPDGVAWLSVRERQLLLALHEPARADWLAGRWAAKQAVSRLLGGSPTGELEIDSFRAEKGAAAPRVRKAGGVALSLTHCAGHGAAVAARSPMRLGVDLERETRPSAAHRRYYLTPSERRAAQVGDAAALWPIKEAAWKAVGCTDVDPLLALELAFDAQGRVVGVGVRDEWRTARAWVSRPWAGFVLATVLLGGAER